jgi:hypothetical protein
MEGIPLADQTPALEDEDGMDADDESDTDDRPLANLLPAKIETVEMDFEDSEDEMPLREVLSAKGSFASTTRGSTAGPAPSPVSQNKRVAPPIVPVASPVQPCQSPPPATAAPVATKRIRLVVKAPSASTSVAASSSNIAPAGPDTVDLPRNKPIPYAQPGPTVTRWSYPPAKPAGRSVPRFQKIHPVKAEQVSPPAKVSAPTQVMNFRKIQRPPARAEHPSSAGLSSGVGADSSSSMATPPPGCIRTTAVPVKLEDSSSASIQFVGQLTVGTSDTPIDLCDSSNDEAVAKTLTFRSRLSLRSPIKKSPIKKSPAKIRTAPKYSASPLPLATLLGDAVAPSAGDKGKDRAMMVGPPGHISRSFGAAAAAVNQASAAAVESEALRQLGLSADDEDDDEPVLVHMARIPIELSDGDDDDEAPICTGRIRVPRPPRRFKPTLTGGGVDSPIELD